MRKGTSPDLTFSTEFLASEITRGYISFRQAGRVILEKDIPGENVAVSDYEIALRLTQEETLLFSSNSVDVAEVQIRLVLNTEEAVASNIVKFYMGDIIKQGVI